MVLVAQQVREGRQDLVKDFPVIGDLRIQLFNPARVATSGQRCKGSYTRPRHLATKEPLALQNHHSCCAGSHYLDHVRSRLPILNNCKCKRFACRFLASAVSDLHLLEHRSIEQDSKGLMGAHDESTCLGRSLIWRTRCDIEFEDAPAALFPYVILERIQARSRSEQ